MNEKLQIRTFNINLDFLNYMRITYNAQVNKVFFIHNCPHLHLIISLHLFKVNQ